MNRVVASLAVGLISACVVSWPALPVFTSDAAGVAHAQTQRKPRQRPRPSRPQTKAAPKIAAERSAAANPVHRRRCSGRDRSRISRRAGLGRHRSKTSRRCCRRPTVRGSRCRAAAPTAPSPPACSTAGRNPASGRSSAVVTGVSIGALLAPYAFLGSKFDERTAPGDHHDHRRRHLRGPARPMKASSTPGRCAACSRSA